MLDRHASSAVRAKEGTDRHEGQHNGTWLGHDAASNAASTGTGVAVTLLPVGVVALRDVATVAVVVEVGFVGVAKVVSPDGVVGGVDNAIVVVVAGEAFVDNR